MGCAQSSPLVVQEPARKIETVQHAKAVPSVAEPPTVNHNNPNYDTKAVPKLVGDGHPTTVIGDQYQANVISRDFTPELVNIYTPASQNTAKNAGYGGVGGISYPQAQFQEHNQTQHQQRQKNMLAQLNSEGDIYDKEYERQ